MLSSRRLVQLCALWCCFSGAPARGETLFHDTFETSPFAPRTPRWCERYHHGHWDGSVVRLKASSTDASECAAGEGPLASLSCAEDGCGPCGCCTGSPCSKIGEPQGNAVIQTTADVPGSRRSTTATFAIERQLPVGGTHLGLYAALHPHCHTTVQAILVPDRPGVFHLNVAAFNQFIGGDSAIYRSCLENPLAAISPPLASEIALGEGHTYRWTLEAHLDPAQHVVASTSIEDASGLRLGSGSHTFTEATAGDWFGVAGRGARYAFGAQLSTAASPSGGSPAVLLLDFAASASNARPPAVEQRRERPEGAPGRVQCAPLSRSRVARTGRPGPAPCRARCRSRARPR